jgi:hypothetical protein
VFVQDLDAYKDNSPEFEREIEKSPQFKRKNSDQNSSIINLAFGI